MKSERVKKWIKMVSNANLESELINNTFVINVPVKETDMPSVYEWRAFACFSIGDVKNVLNHAKSVRVD